MSTWQDLSRELDAWGEAGRTATFWWRDDDATAVTPALEHLIALQHKHAAPLALAVIPARAQPALAERLAPESQIAIFQHGWAHENHAPVGAPKAELGPDRPVAYMLGELARGQLVLEKLFGALPDVLVPPHNRIAPALAAALPQAGYAGLSTYHPRKRRLPGLIEINTHIDIMDWTTRAFLGTGPALELAVAHLRARRAGTVDPDEPTGLLTHHLAHDEAAWAFADGFLTAVRGHSAASFCDARALFEPR